MPGVEVENMVRSFSNKVYPTLDSIYYVDICSDYSALKRVLVNFVKDPKKDTLILSKRRVREEKT